MSEYDPTARHEPWNEDDETRLMADLRRYKAIEAAAQAVVDSPTLTGDLIRALADALGPAADDADAGWAATREPR